MQAADSPCTSQPSMRQLVFTQEVGSNTSFDDERGLDVAVSRQRFRFVPQDTDDITFGYGHEYTTVDIDPLPGAQPSSNGHLHRLYVPIDASSLVIENWTLRFQPAISISSNLLKEPAEITADALQFNAALLKQWNVSPDSRWRAGICADYRFGEYRLYPVVSRLWRIDAWSLELGFPDSALSIRLDTDLTAGMRLSP
ncbi:MAG: hypothetical protein HUJ31_07450, partial [Pseudomonadales bacterium]|nr:hypothetical protein [Pseudomonadales bacterium]